MESRFSFFSYDNKNIHKNDNKNASSIYDIHKKNPIKRLTCCSGGARGTSLPGVRKALVDTGVLNDIEAVAGSSAGALFASLLVTNVSDEDLYEVLANTSIFDLLGEKSNTDKRYEPGISFISRDAKPLENKIRELILRSLRKFFESNLFHQKISIHDKRFDQNCPGNYAETDLIKLYYRFQQEQTPKFTYKDLQCLHLAFPEKFKKLIILAVNHETGQPFVFDSDLTPDIEIAVSARASAAIPGVLEPVVLEMNGELIRLVDGGYFEHLPTDYFDKDENNKFIKNTMPENTLVFIFSDLEYNNSTGYKALYGKQFIDENGKQIIDGLNSDNLYAPPFIDRLQRNWLGPYFSGIKADYYNTDKWNQSYQRIRAEYALNSVVIDVSDIKAYHYNAATKFGREMCAAAYLDTVFHLTSHELDHPECFPDNFFVNLAHAYEVIYEAILIGKKLSIHEDEFALQLMQLKAELKQKLKDDSPLTLARQICEFIRDAMRSNLHSLVSMAFTFSLGYCNSSLSSKMLFQQVCAGLVSVRERKGFEVLLFVGLVEKENVQQLISFDELVKKMELGDEANNNLIKKVFECLEKIDLFREDQLLQGYACASSLR
jgi:predicted acylesterase/phospholipase RssA